MENKPSNIKIIPLLLSFGNTELKEETEHRY